MAVGAEALEDPREIGLDRNALGAAGGDDAKEDTRTMRALSATGEQHREPELATFWNSRSVGELSIGT